MPDSYDKCEPEHSHKKRKNITIICAYNVCGHVLSSQQNQTKTRRSHDAHSFVRSCLCVLITLFRVNGRQIMELKRTLYTFFGFVIYVLMQTRNFSNFWTLDFGDYFPLLVKKRERRFPNSYRLNANYTTLTSSVNTLTTRFAFKRARPTENSNIELPVCNVYNISSHVVFEYSKMIISERSSFLLRMNSCTNQLQSTNY